MELQALPQAPQCDVLPLKLTSQPFAKLPSQLFHPRLQAQAPLLQELLVPQAELQAPQ